MLGDGKTAMTYLHMLIQKYPSSQSATYGQERADGFKYP